jgi:cytochrome oxidase assembly protein ShyY1
VFAPTPGFTLLAVALAALCVALGVWQWRRGSAREAAWQSFERGAAVLVELGDRPLTDVPLFQRVRLRGRLDGAHQFLLDNRTHAGRAGYEVLTPLQRPAGVAVLVDRGWVPFTGTRAQLPDVRLPAADDIALSGRSALLPSPGLAAGRAAPAPTGPWPKVTSYPDMPQLAQALGESLGARVLLLDPQAPLGFVRDWQAPGLPPLRHFSYALQWWSFALLALIIWALLSRRPPRLPA